MPPEETKAPTPENTSSSSLGTNPGEGDLKQIRTFQGDIAEALKQRDASVVSLARAEHVRQEEKVAPAVTSPVKTDKAPRAPLMSEEHKHALLLTLGTVVLLGLTSVGGWFTYNEYRDRSALPAISVPDNRLIPAQSERSINALTATRNSLINDIHSSPLEVKGVEHIQLGTGIQGSGSIPTKDLFSILQVGPPASLVRAFDPIFMLGVYKADAPHTFLLIKIDSFENAFPGMLAWEKTLAVDLLPLFVNPPNTELPLAEAKFEDVTIRNKDARVLRDATGKTVLLYSFFDSRILIITDNEETLRTLIGKLTSESLTR